MDGRVATVSAQVLKTFPLFAGLDDAVRADLARVAVRRALAAGDRLWRAGDDATHFTLILSGLVKIVRAAADGSETIVALFGPRESIGEPAVLDRGTYPAGAVAASDAEVLRVDAAPVLGAMDRDPSVARAMNRALLEHTRALQEKIRILSAGTVPMRLATLFLHLAERFGDETPEGTTVVHVRLARAELAEIVGATVETTIRALSRWQKAGYFATTPDGFVLKDTAALVAITKGADAG